MHLILPGPQFDALPPTQPSAIRQKWESYRNRARAELGLDGDLMASNLVRERLGEPKFEKLGEDDLKVTYIGRMARVFMKTK